ncbi:2OG-Fe(II) oxygenase [Luteimonas sp. MJ246]|uniref:2OG-Fe(II) oxygenase n=1 Tax=Luteimonas sp. MJ174 TaxID=3129237 RepID=UPI0031B9F5BA
MSHASAADFIEVTPGALDAATCAAIVERMRASDALQPGRVGGGVFPELKKSRDIALAGRPEWADAEQALNVAVYRGLLAYIRRYPQVLIAPLMLQQPMADGGVRRLEAGDITAMDDRTLGRQAMACLRPGPVNLQWYAAGEGGYPYWHCELYPHDPQAETLHRHLLWTVYLNDGFDAGETEFMFQQRKVKPRTGDLLIAPTAFTHTHRGNRPAGGDKFIATSWILFQRAEALFAGA